MADLAQLEPWLTKREVAEHFRYSVRTWERKARGAPSAEILGRTRYRLSEVEPWMREQGLMKQRNNG